MGSSHRWPPAPDGAARRKALRSGWCGSAGPSAVDDALAERACDRAFPAGRGRREFQHEGRAFGGFGELDHSAILLGELARDGEAETAADGRYVRAEKLLADGRRQTRSVIGDTHHHGGARTLDGNVHGLQRAAAARHADRIVEQVEYDAEELFGIGPGRERSLRVDPDLETRGSQRLRPRREL